MSDAPFDSSGMEKWLEEFFLDPFTSFLDQTQFRIDLYETEKEWIVEALLMNYDSSEITVYISDQELTITAAKSGNSSSTKDSVRKRIVTFPFLIIQKKIHATFKKGTLEIFISKTEPGLGKDRFVTLP
ncbi:Hsp20/alpha crystallin family protein [Neobacillus sp. PS3-34]|uniref:Hsp20/alpha crystallin family protein n=1 Tax=Neobacillus sp. PS3-34 TaxID=3070678 RepID=UPI0027E1270A|nr:Hsp20/alpha crystallin family protein [Neobacillus sp. PS3-34]WML48179.1 Hsp20/alpha crystallin family protein [Neobacillus sp. PS3-34]